MGYKKIEEYDDKATSSISDHYEDILTILGEDPKREGLEKTPERVAKSLQFLLHGYDVDPVEIMNSALFNEAYDEMVIVKNIEILVLLELKVLEGLFCLEILFKK